MYNVCTVRDYGGYGPINLGSREFQVLAWLYWPGREILHWEIKIFIIIEKKHVSYSCNRAPRRYGNCLLCYLPVANDLREKNFLFITYSSDCAKIKKHLCFVWREKYKRWFIYMSRDFLNKLPIVCPGTTSTVFCYFFGLWHKTRQETRVSNVISHNLQLALQQSALNPMYLARVIYSVGWQN